MDIRHFFESVDHDVLKAWLKKKIDVYKRQMSEYGTTVEDTYNGTLDPIDNATIAMNNAKLALSTLATTAQTAAAPVSYTHLGYSCRPRHVWNLRKRGHDS